MPRLTDLERKAKRSALDKIGSFFNPFSPSPELKAQPLEKDKDKKDETEEERKRRQQQERDQRELNELTVPK